MATLKKYPFVDIHSHFLFGVDDGAKNQGDALQMLREAAEENIRHLVATPHATDLTNEIISDQFQKHFSILQEQIAQEKLDIEISLGSELYFSDKIYNWMKYPWATLNNNKKYLLFELPLYELPNKVDDFIFQCKLEGITPILAHPERYVYLRKNLSKIKNWHRQGCLLQVNAGSITGLFGLAVAQLAKRLILSGMAQFIASDAHDSKYRNYSVVTKAYDVLSGLIPDDYLEQLFYINPQKSIEGKDIDPFEVDERLLRDSIYSFRGIYQRIYSVFVRMPD